MLDRIKVYWHFEGGHIARNISQDDSQARKCIWETSIQELFVWKFSLSSICLRIWNRMTKMFLERHFLHDFHCGGKPSGKCHFAKGMTVKTACRNVTLWKICRGSVGAHEMAQNLKGVLRRFSGKCSFREKFAYLGWTNLCWKHNTPEAGRLSCKWLQTWKRWQSVSGYQVSAFRTVSSDWVLHVTKLQTQLYSGLLHCVIWCVLDRTPFYTAEQLRLPNEDITSSASLISCGFYCCT